MESTKVISFVGMERCDVINYLTNMLKSKKIRTLVIDNSCSHDLFNSLNKPDNTTDYVEQGRIVFMRNKCVEPTDLGAFEKFDVVVIYHGLNVNYDMVFISDYLVIQMNYLPHTVCSMRECMNLKELMTLPQENILYLYRDKGSTKVSEAQIRKLLDIPVVENEQIIFYDEGNYSAYLNFLWNGSQETKGVSNEMKALISMLQGWLVGADKKKKGGSK